MGLYFTMDFFAGKFSKEKIYKGQEREIIKIMYGRKNISDICD